MSLRLIISNYCWKKTIKPITFHVEILLRTGEKTQAHTRALWRQVIEFLDATTDHFDWLFFFASVDYHVVPSISSVVQLWLAFWAKKSIFGHCEYFCGFWKLEIKLKNWGIENGGLLNDKWTPNYLDYRF